MKNVMVLNGVSHGQIDALEITQKLSTFIDYDDDAGVLRWTNQMDRFKLLPVSLRRRVSPGDVIDSTRPGHHYQVKINGRLRNALPLIWQLCTGHKRRVMTMLPHESCFKVSNLCLIPSDRLKAPKTRAKGRHVVSWCYERKQYTVVKVGDDYSKAVLSYHDDVDDAIKSTVTPVLSFM